MASLQSNQAVFSSLECGAHPKRLQPSRARSSLAALLLPVWGLIRYLPRSSKLADELVCRCPPPAVANALSGHPPRPEGRGFSRFLVSVKPQERRTESQISAPSEMRPKSRKQTGSTSCLRPETLYALIATFARQAFRTSTSCKPGSCAPACRSTG